jgi:kumamolisin
MVAQSGKTNLKGSERARLPGAHVVGPSSPDERLEATVVVRRRSSSKVPALVAEFAGKQVRDRKPVSREDFAATHGADPDDLAKVAKFAEENKLVVVEKSIARRSVLLSGRVEDFNNAFGVKLEQYQHPGGSYRGRVGAVQVPPELTDVVTAILGLDDRPQAKSHFQTHPAAANAQAAGGSFTPAQVAKLYGFPTGDGQGQCIGIIELGGGYKTADLRAYFKKLGLPLPKVSAVSVDGGHNHPAGDPNSADGEVMLDIEVAGAVAPKANIVVYFAPNTDQGFLDAITHAVHDTHHKPSVISISWGGAESNWTSQAMQAFDQAFQDAAALGVTICCASGDNGSGDGVGDSHAHVDFPASSPHALACGGTRLEGAGATISKETVWNDDPNNSATGGGVSDEFDLPSYQKNAGVPPSANPGGRIGRGVPDVAGDADPVSGYQVLVDGQSTVIGGTSAVAPLWAGLIALINQRLGVPVGFLNPVLYDQAAAKGGFSDITAGDNGDYSSGAGWDACTGLGSPNGTKLVSALGG